MKTEPGRRTEGGLLASRGARPGHRQRAAVCRHGQRRVPRTHTPGRHVGSRGTDHQRPARWRSAPQPHAGLWLMGCSTSAWARPVTRATDQSERGTAESSPNGKSRSIFASGLRNTIGFAWDPKTGMWGMDHGIDYLGNDEQPDELNRIQKGKKYGWSLQLGQGRVNPRAHRQGRSANSNGRRRRAHGATPPTRPPCRCCSTLAAVPGSLPGRLRDHARFLEPRSLRRATRWCGFVSRRRQAGRV